ncbi:MAG: tape measure protein [Thermoleophilaceae bacterium]|nr:tape measure protein [Thermoleophilaceae bacterium]
MSFNLQIKVDPGSSVGNVKQVTSELRNAEAQATKTNRSIADSMRSTERATNATADAFEREAKILERIHGPMKQLEQDMRSLEALHRKGKISAKEYADELARVGKNAGLSRGNPIDAVSLGPTPTGAKGAGFGGMMKVAGPLLAAGATMKHLDDEYSKNAFSAARFTEAGKDVNAVLKEQLGLAHQLRAPLDQTMELYDAVRDGTDDLNISRKEQMDLTRSLGAAMRLDNKTLQEAGGLMTTLSYAWASGSIAGRELKGVMKQSGEIAEALTDHFGKNRKELVKMADEGKLSMYEFRKAIEESGEKWTKELADRPKSMSESLHEMATTAKLAFGRPLPTMKEFEKQAHSIAIANQRGNVFLDAAAQASGNMTVAQYDSIQAILKQQKELGHLGDAFNHLAEQMKIIKSLNSSVFDPWADKRNVLGVLRDRVLGKANRVKDVLEEREERRKAAEKQKDELAPGWSYMGSFTGLDAMAGTRGGDFDKQFEGIKSSLAELEQGFANAAKEAEEYDKALREVTQEAYAEELSRQRDELLKLNEEMAQGFGDIAQDIAKMAFDGKASFKDMIQSMMSDLLRLMAMKAIGSLLNPASALSQGAFESQFMSGVPGFATGGSFMVGGAGGTDTTPVSFMATRGERVSIDTPGQQMTRDGGGGGGGARAINIHLNSQDAVAALDTPAGEQLIVRVIRQNAPALRRYLSGR